MAEAMMYQAGSAVQQHQQHKHLRRPVAQNEEFSPSVQTDGARTPYEDVLGGLDRVEQELERVERHRRSLYSEEPLPSLDDDEGIDSGDGNSKQQTLISSSSLP
eukprot:GHVQ01034280.1.p2 GENE.GHVQ01034280.1~~GHVQ01034280.1.p2  ORF type:complete len:104 (-),score=32.58 GHVQ01034280.1:228-539(-)